MVLCPTKRIYQLALALLVVSILVFTSVSTNAEHGARQPYLVEHEQTGLIGCAVAYKMIQGKDFCGDSDPNAQSVFDFPLDARLTSMVLQVEQRGGVIEADEFSITFQKPVGIHGVSGPLPIQATWTFDATNAWPSWEEDGQTITIDTRVFHGATTPQVAYNQSFRVCLGLFYNGEEVPEGYAPCSEE